MMPKTKSFRLLYEKMPPESRAAVEHRVQETLREMQIAKEREAELMTQEMAGHKPFRLLREKMSPERLASSDARVQMTLREIRLAELRESLQTSQQQLKEIYVTKRKQT